MPRKSVDAREAALILRGVVDRVDDNQQESEPEGETNYLRGIEDEMVATDSVSATTISNLTISADTTGDEWGFGHAE